MGLEWVVMWWCLVCVGRGVLWKEVSVHWGLELVCCGFGVGLCLEFWWW